MTMAFHQTVRFAAPKGSQGSVLLIESDAAAAQTLIQMMNAEGVEVVLVGTGTAAIDRMMDHSFDAVISDLHLPGTSGVQVLDVVRAYDPDMPLVLMTNAPSVDTATEACDLGVLEYLVKPTPREQLVRVLGRARKVRRSAQQNREAAELAPLQTSTADTVRPPQIVIENALGNSAPLAATMPAPSMRSSGPTTVALEDAMAIVKAASATVASLVSAEPDASSGPCASNDTVATTRSASDTPTVVCSSFTEEAAPVTVEAPAPLALLSNGAYPSLRTTFERALASLMVELEPIADAKSKKLIGFAARMGSTEETLATEPTLVVAAEHLGRLEELRRRVRDLAVKAFAGAPPDALLFVDVHPTDLMDGDLYSPAPPLARIADRVVLQLRARGLAIEDLSARASVLRFVGFRFAVADLDVGQACLSQMAELSPEFVKIDARLIRAMDRSAGRRRLVSALVSMCRTLDAVSIAEGVSTAEEREALLEAGCVMVQGSIAARHVQASTRRPGLAPARGGR
jgi:EAL domain-containing protein (putative c-di-GMP-specific phosphodiesterase class I)